MGSPFKTRRDADRRLPQVLLAAFTALVVVFAARKFTQPVKDDIGDKSVFQFQALPEAEQQAKLAAMQRSKEPSAEDEF